MAFLERIRSAASALRGVRKGAFSDAFLRGMDVDKLRSTITDPYRQHAWVYACLTIIMRKISSVPFVLAERKKDKEGNQKELPETHPAVRLFETVNPEMGPSELWQATALYLTLRGEAIWLLEFKAGQVVEIWPADPKKAQPIYDAQRNVIGWTLQDGAVSVPFSNDEIVRFRYLNPSDPLRGLAPIEAARLAIDQDYKAARHNEALLENSAIPGGVVSIPDALSMDELSRLKRQWDEGHGGTSKRGKIGWLMGGMTFTPAGMDLKELDFIEGRRFNREEILAVFGVPPAEVGVHEFSNYANASEQAKKFWQNTLLPILSLFEETLDPAFFKKHFPDAVGYFDLTNVEALKEDFQKQVLIAKDLWSMGVPFADINSAFDFPFDVSDKPWLQVGYQQISLVPSAEGEGWVFPTGERPVEIPPDTTEPPPPPPPPTASFRPMRQKASPRALGRKLRQLYNRETRVTIPRMEKAVAKYFRAEGKDVVREVKENYDRIAERNAKAVLATLAEWKGIKASQTWGMERKRAEFRKFTATHTKDLTADVERYVFGVDESTGELRKIATPLTKAALQDAGAAVSELLGISFDEEAQGVFDALDAHENLLKNIPEETFNAVRDSIVNSIENGQTYQQAADSIAELYEGFEESRVLAIAQTEMGFAYNTAAYQSYDQSGIEKHRWLTIGDANVRQTHLANEAQGAIEIGTAFSNGSLYPGDGEVGEVVNCRCTTIPEIVIAASIRAVPTRKILRVNGQKQRIVIG